MQNFIVIHQYFLQLLIRRTWFKNHPSLRVIFSWIFIKICGSQIGDCWICFNDQSILKFHTMIDCWWNHTHILIIKHQHICIHEGNVPFMWYFILDLLDKLYLIQIRRLTWVFKLNFGHIKAKIWFYYIGFNIFEEQCFKIIISFGLSC